MAVAVFESNERAVERLTPTEDDLPRIDLLLLTATLSLVGLGLVMVYSASAVHAADRYGYTGYFLLRSAIYAAIGLLGMIVAWRIDYGWYQRFTYPLLFITFALLIGLLIPGVGTHVDGAVRWYRLAGFSFQPSEAAKLTLVIFLAASLAKKKEQMRTFSVGVLPHLVIAGLMTALVLKQPDLGNSAILLAVSFFLMLVGGARLSYIVALFLAALPVGYQLIVGTPWRLRRMLAFLDPWAYRKDAGYQVSESLISVGSGGLFGLGLGNGKQKLFFLPAAHTDFIFAVTGEELGYIGVLCVILLFALIVVRGLRASLNARDLFGTYLAFGITATLGLQALFHMFVVLGLVPTKGITLPLFSSGGSGLITNLVSVGVLLNVAARNPAPEDKVPTPRPAKTQSNRRRPSRVVVKTE